MCIRPYFPPGASMPVGCGKCFECCQQYSTMWSQRIMDEASLYKENCMITLTYAETDGTLCKRDVQLFIKRLRERIKPKKIRYYLCGEYGGKGNRPHYHVIVFNYFPNDAVFVKKDKNNVVYYSSKFIEDVWQKGFISVGNVTINTAKYCAKYLGKFDIRPHQVKPFTLMSRRPGIGALCINGDMLIDGCRYFKGKKYYLPKYYIDKLESKGYNVDIIKATRKEYVKRKFGDYYDVKEEKQKNERKEEYLFKKYFR